ncbi:hypothetical protein GCM10011365_04840 [Marinicella pacifica]|uniref:Uncharacterized protein n=2 Tax=Marinicella pacifica TaxID=1171543 RepID=A0A917FIA4_9GAMM|nr:hypothetical protein GCM10011365_04840 [Marinicella pacifica]
MAQPVTVVEDNLLSANYFTAIITGVILALAIQFVLTALSVAMGISAIGDVRSRYVDAKLDVSPDDSQNRDINSDAGDSMSLGVKVTSGFGLWSVLTTCIALFVGTALAINLSVIQTPVTAAVMALVIWAVFFILLFYLETKVAGTVLGNLIATVTAGIKSGSQAVAGLFEPSEQKKLDQMIRHGIGTFKDELDSQFDWNEVSQKIDAFTAQLDRKVPDYDELRADLNDMVKTSRHRDNSAMWMVIQQVLTQAINKQNNLPEDEAKKKALQLRELIDEMRDSYAKGDNAVEGLKYVVANFSNQEKADVDKRLEEFKKRLSEATPERFSKAQLQQDLDDVLNDPNTLTTIIANKFEGVNRESIIEALDNNTRLDKDQLNGYADSIEAGIERIVSEFDKDNVNRLSKRMERKVAAFLDRTGRDELAYAELKQDVMDMVDEPRHSVEVLKARLDQFDRDTIRALVTNNRFINDEHIDRVVQTIEDAKQTVADKLHKADESIRRTARNLQRKAVIKAEHARKLAAVAAWWLVASAVLSAGAAVLATMVVM